VFEGVERGGHDAIYFEHFGARGLRKGDWKLVALQDHGWELYNLGEDRTETRDLAKQRPELVKELAALWERWAERAQVYPAPGR
jgi:arylsulfatase